VRFETILDAYGLACGKLDYRTQSHDEFITNLRQCDAFRARLERMYHGLERDFYNVLITSAGEYDEEQDG